MAQYFESINSALCGQDRHHNNNHKSQLMDKGLVGSWTMPKIIQRYIKGEAHTNVTSLFNKSSKLEKQLYSECLRKI